MTPSIQHQPAPDMQTRDERTYLANDPVGRDGGSKSSPPEAGIGGVVLDGRRRDGDAENQCSANQGKWPRYHGDVLMKERGLIIVS